MRLLYLTRTYSGHDARWLRALSGAGVTVGFLPLQAVDGTAVACAHPAVELLPALGLPGAATTASLDAAESALRAAVATWAPDVILAGPVTDAGYLATRILTERTLLCSWAFDLLHEPQTLPGARERAVEALVRARHFFADCAAVLALATGLAGHAFEQTCVLPWGLASEDRPAPRFGWRSRLGDGTARVVVHARGFAPVHQPERVVEAFAQAHAGDRSLRLWLAGSGERADAARALAGRLGIAGSVHFFGRLDQAELAGCFAEADASVACALSDGSSIALLQAMHAGLPCVAADLPGNREWLGDEGGWLVPADSTAALAAAIRAATQLSPAERARVAARNRAQVQARADLAANLPRLIATLRAIAGCASEAHHAA